jgi:hypothetical protein
VVIWRHIESCKDVDTENNEKQFKFGCMIYSYEIMSDKATTEAGERMKNHR